MTLSPLVERELRALARRPGFFWLRGLLALATAFQGYQMLDSALVPAPGAKLLHQITHLLFFAVLLMGLLSADSISRERREGTLGLLFLTNLSSWQIACGKLLSHGLTAFLALLGCLPALMVSILLGGVTAAEALLSGIGLLNTLFVALAAGLWASARFRPRHHVFPITISLLVALVVGPQVLGGALLGLSAQPFASLFSLSGWMPAARASAPLRFPFVCWFLLMQAAGWLLLRNAAAALARNWQDEPHPLTRPAEPETDWPASAHKTYDRRCEEGPLESPDLRDRRADSQARDAEVSQEERAADSPSLAVPAALPEARPWDGDPVRWRVQRIGTPEAAIWLALAPDLLAQFAALGPLFRETGSGDSAGLLCALGTVTILGSSAVLAWVGARFFQDARRQHDLELLLTTPVGSRNIVTGQWRMLRRALAWPLALILAIGLPSAISIIHHLAHNDYAATRYFLPPFLIAVNLAVEVLALCWVGMWFGLRGRSILTSVAAAVSLVQLAPFLPALILSGAWVGGQRVLPPLIPALFFFLAKNVACITWARLSLARELRVGAGDRVIGGKALAFRTRDP